MPKSSTMLMSIGAGYRNLRKREVLKAEMRAATIVCESRLYVSTSTIRHVIKEDFGMRERRERGLQ